LAIEITGVDLNFAFLITFGDVQPIRQWRSKNQDPSAEEWFALNTPD
jgi:hypothetical protein